MTRSLQFLKTPGIEGYKDFGGFKVVATAAANKSEVVQVIEVIGSPGRTRTADPVINSPSKLKRGASACIQLTDFSMMRVHSDAHECTRMLTRYSRITAQNRTSERAQQADSSIECALPCRGSGSTI